MSAEPTAFVPAGAAAALRPVRSSLRRGLLVRFGVGFVGIGAVAVIVRQIGIDPLRAVLVPAAASLPLLLLVDVARIGADAVGTRLALGDRARSVPFRIFLRTQIIGNAVASIAPSGRAACEATKAALLTRWVGGPTATANATLLQSLSLVAGAAISIPCIWAALHLSGLSTLTGLIFAQAVLAAALGLGIRLATRAQKLGGFLERRFRRFAEQARQFRASARDAPLFPVAPFAAVALGRALQIVQFWLLVRAVGISASIEHALLAQGVNMVAIAAGSFVPGQLGASDGAFALSAEALGCSVASAVAIALLAHVLQVIWLGVGALVPLVWKLPETEQQTPACSLDALGRVDQPEGTREPAS
jgi:hypothetical protein